MEQVRRWAVRVGLVLVPVLAALYVGGTQIAGGSLWPWHPNMIDLQVYQRAGQILLSGGDIYASGGELPWIYPPFGALLTVPFAVLSADVAAAVWLLLCTAALAAMLYRLGYTGWLLSLLTTLAILFVQPVRDTLGFGQLGIFLVAAAVLDSMPGPRLLRRRVLPEGWLVGIATAVKLTPAVVAAYNFFAGRRKPGIVAFLGFLAATAVAFAVLPAASLTYWHKLLSGDSGLNSGIVYATNQSVLGMWNRLTGAPSRGGLVLSALVVVLGVVAAVLMHRAGQTALALCLAGLTSLLASPISWSHHYVWVVPLGIVLWQRSELPGVLRWAGLGYVAWLVVAPFMWLPRGDNIELTYAPWQQVVDNLGVVAGVLLLAGSAAAALSSWGRQRRALP
ncbi:MAG: glycosyltransferase 87 family protein [Propionicimonas sp.]|uniref:glycosyltransferase 87 family protein n=1 Tax=Propionicimonas sp. TaxID=1955623 RepID=UPI003D0CE45B